jgi:hypothetical protein
MPLKDLHDVEQGLFYIFSVIVKNFNRKYFTRKMEYISELFDLFIGFLYFDQASLVFS